MFMAKWEMEIVMKKHFNQIKIPDDGMEEALEGYLGQLSSTSALKWQYLQGVIEKYSVC